MEICMIGLSFAFVNHWTLKLDCLDKFGAWPGKPGPSLIATRAVPNMFARADATKTDTQAR